VNFAQNSNFHVPLAASTIPIPVGCCYTPVRNFNSGGFAMRSLTLASLLIILVAAASQTRADEHMHYAGRTASKFVTFPGLPACMTGSVQNGDPSKGASVILAKSTAGCKIPWHWHTAGEQLMFISGNAKVEMKDGSPTALHAGDYVSLPGKQAHQFTCATACTLFIVPDGAFDIHYVDASGKEISPDDALKGMAKAKSAMKKPSGEMKK
jgi:quercetin dioxygenase-like cupin family protein